MVTIVAVVTAITVAAAMATIVAVATATTVVVVSMVGRNLALAAGMCGSVSGSVPTSVGQPALKVDKILVGGNA